MASEMLSIAKFDAIQFPGAVTLGPLPSLNDDVVVVYRYQLACVYVAK